MGVSSVREHPHSSSRQLISTRRLLYVAVYTNMPFGVLRTYTLELRPGIVLSRELISQFCTQDPPLTMRNSRWRASAVHAPCSKYQRYNSSIASHTHLSLVKFFAKSTYFAVISCTLHSFRPETS